MEKIIKKLDENTIEITYIQIIKKVDLEANKRRIEDRITANKLEIDIREQDVLDDINSQLAEFN